MKCLWRYCVSLDWNTRLAIQYNTIRHDTIHWNTMSSLAWTPSLLHLSHKLSSYHCFSYDYWWCCCTLCEKLSWSCVLLFVLEFPQDPGWGTCSLSFSLRECCLYEIWNLKNKNLNSRLEYSDFLKEVDDLRSEPRLWNVDVCPIQGLSVTDLILEHLVQRSTNDCNCIPRLICRAVNWLPLGGEFNSLHRSPVNSMWQTQESLQGCLGNSCKMLCPSWL